MSTTIAAMKGRLGNTDYFILAMKAGDLVAKAVIPSEMREWKNMTMDEKEQRDINYARVKSQIAPYLAKHKDRFFGAVILAAQNFNPSNFEQLSEIAKKGLPNLYKAEAEKMGFLTLTGGEVFIPIDGQHRIKAIQFAIDGKDEKSKDLGLSSCPDLANEDVAVMLVPYEARKVRKIFTRVNRYAKPTSSGQNLITDDEDYIAISAREVADWINRTDSNSSERDVELVKTTGNALGDKEHYFTTLATIAECNRIILQAWFPDPITKPFIVSDPDTLHLYKDKISEVWEHLAEHIEPFAIMLSDKSEAGNEKRHEVREHNLLGKPVPQVCLFRAYARLIVESNMYPATATGKLSKIDWQKDAQIWDRLLMTGGKIMHKNAKIATDIIYYVAGGKHKDEAELLAEYQKLFTGKEKPTQLPEKVV